MPRYLTRSLASVLARAVREFPAVVVTGPRQSGKTTMLRRQFGETHRYVSLEIPDLRLAADTDPRGFLAAHPPPVVFDEVQHAPDLLPYIKESIDRDRAARGRYILTGSQNLLMLEKVTESLAGRSAWLTLWPLTGRELAGQSERGFPWSRRGGGSEGTGLAFGTLWERLLAGWYPEPATEPDRDLELWHESYLRTYVERDVRAIRQIGDRTQFQLFLRALAHRAGQLLRLSEISRDLGIAVNTVKAWISVLEASHQIVRIQPWHRNVGKRLVKTPRIYFADTGTLCRLVGLADADHLRDGPMAGAVMENAVVMEILKSVDHRGERPRLSFFRTSDGHEVDLVLELGERLVPVEVKATATPLPRMGDDIRLFRALAGEAVAPGYVVHSGDVTSPLGEGVSALPFAGL
jgi:predicted AAA+ superfamily ATPase